MSFGPNTKAEALVKRYSKTHMNQRGVVYNPLKCAAEVSDNQRWAHYHQCSRKPGFGPDGIFCKVHDPETIAARTKKRADKYNEESKRWNVRFAAPALLAACKEALIFVEEFSGAGNANAPRIVKMMKKAIKSAESK